MLGFAWDPEYYYMLMVGWFFLNVFNAVGTSVVAIPDAVGPAAMIPNAISCLAV